MHVENVKPAAPAMALAGSELQSWAATHSDHSTLPLIINRLRQQFAISAPHALTIARLAGLGPKEAN
ncbi:hypothetical protein [Bosea sp. NPDC055594]